MNQAGRALSGFVVCVCVACDREPEPPPAADPLAAQEEISPETRERVEEFLRERADDEGEALEDEPTEPPASLITFSLEGAPLADLIRILSNITREHIAVASVLDGSLDCVTIAVTTRQEITVAHALELTRVALAETGIELRHTPHGFVVRPLDGRTVACGSTGRASLESVPAPATPYVERPFDVEPGPDDLAFSLERASLDEVARVLSESGQTFEVDAALATSAECVRVSIQGQEPVSLEAAVELARLAVADANVELDRRNVFRSIAGREIRCSTAP